MIFAIDMKRRTPEMYMTALENTGMSLFHFPNEMKTPEIAMKAVKNNGLALMFVPEALKTPEMCRIAVHNLPAGYAVRQIIDKVPFSEVCLEQLKKCERKKENPFLVFGSMKPDIITPEMAQLAVRLEPSCIQFVPDHLKTLEKKQTEKKENKPVKRKGIRF